MIAYEQLNSDQKNAIEGIIAHVLEKEEGPRFAVLDGSAGTGKSTCSKFVFERLMKIEGYNLDNVAFTAPTNKATKVVRDMIGEGRAKEDMPLIVTIYSLLGLRMEPNGEVKELQKKEVDLGSIKVVWVDERTMCGETISNHIIAAAKQYPQIKWIFSGDPFQLSPVNEDESPTNDIKRKFILTKVERTDNQILKLAVRLRAAMIDGDWENPSKHLLDDRSEDGTEGVFLIDDEDELDRLVEQNLEGFKDGSVRFAAWRNVTVENINASIRKLLFPDARDPWVEGDRITCLEPIRDPLSNQIVATTDDDGVVLRVTPAFHPIYEMRCWRITVQLDYNDQIITIWQISKEHVNDLQERLQNIANKAHKMPSEWKKYWELREAFHSVRHAYAGTVHRFQGSTHIKTFVEFRDILRNYNKVEAMRCLFVACTRPRQALYLC